MPKPIRRNPNDKNGRGRNQDKNFIVQSSSDGGGIGVGGIENRTKHYLLIFQWMMLALFISITSVYLPSIISSALFSTNTKTNDNIQTLPLYSSTYPTISRQYIQDFENKLNKSKLQSLQQEFKHWIQENDFIKYEQYFKENGIVTLVSVVQLDEIARVDSYQNNNIQNPSTTNENENSEEDKTKKNIILASSILKEIPQQDKERLKRAALILRQRLILRLWLDDHGLAEYSQRFNSLGVNSIEDAYWFEEYNKLETTIGKKIIPIWIGAKKSLPTGGISELENLKLNLWNRLVKLDHQAIWNNWGTMLLVTLSVTGFGAMVSYFPKLLDAKKSIFQYVSGKFSLASNCQVEFDWEDPAPVGQICTMKIRFFQRGGRPYPICDRDNILIEVRKDSHKLNLITEFGRDDSGDVNLILVKFSVKKSGNYSINLLADNNHVKGSPFTKMFLPTSIDSTKTVFLKQTSTVVCVMGSNHKLIIEPRDSFGNRCRNQDYKLQHFNFITNNIGVTESENNVNCSINFAHDYSNPSINFSPISYKPVIVRTIQNQESARISLTTKFTEAGVYRGILSYDSIPIQNGSFEILVLDSGEAAAVQKNVASKSPRNYYEGKLLSIGNEIQNKTRKIYVSVSSKQLQIKEYFLKLLPIRVATFRLSPNTKIQFNGANNQLDVPSILTIDDGSQPPIKIMLKDAKVVLATFTHFLLRNIGGSETFQDKQEYFFKELRDLHRKQTRDKVSLKLTRENIIESTWKTTKNLSSNDWCRNFDISFANEQGIDWGGLRREWFEKISSKLFENGNPVGMFLSFPDSHLVHPNSNSKWKPKHYEMAGKIVGKCLYESSLGSAYRQMAKAKFTRSFLAQLIGLRVNYKYFEHDDPELYLRKIKFILENDVDGMELTFIEEEYEFGKLIKTVDLIPDGSKILVTNDNKKLYLNALAQYRLCTKVKGEIDGFIKGLNEIVPDDLLTIFDENELELLICGTSEYSVTDLREHHIVCGSSEEYKKILDWFWSIVGNMTEEEKGRLLQFTTGSSLLPPGGFKELSPLFQIIFTPTSGTLPTAHTCFNQLCLPDYDSYENFEKSLRIAINEGSEGFGLI